MHEPPGCMIPPAMAPFTAVTSPSLGRQIPRHKRIGNSALAPESGLGWPSPLDISNLNDDMSLSKPHHIPTFTKRNK